MALLHEQIEGKYEILQKVKEGGMGAIYKGRHRLLDELRIIKVIRSHANPVGEAGERFLREARSAIRLRHPNIATLHDFAIAGGALLLLAVLAAGVWWGLRASSAPHRVAEAAAASRPALPEPLPASVPVSTEAAFSGPPAAVPAPPAPARPQAKAPPDPLPEKARSTAAVREPPAETVPFQRGDLIRPGPGVEVPVPLDIPPYSYPEAARGSGKKASVRVALLVDEEGQVIEAHVREGDKSGLGCNEAALETARKVRFQPPSKGDVPGKMWTELILDFSDETPG